MKQWLCRFLCSSIVKKVIMAITGLLLCGFLISHLTGNLLLLVSADAFNIYAHTLVSNPLIYVAEAGLLAIFLTHLALAFKLTLENKKARGVSYYKSSISGSGAGIASRTMPITGIIILAFVIKHILDFKFGPVYMTEINGEEIRDLHKTVIEFFSSIPNTALYVIAMISTGLHVSHGFQSAFQSLGWMGEKFTPVIKKVSLLYALAVGGGFSALAIACHLQGGAM